MALQFHPLPVTVFPDKAQPYIMRFNREIADLFGLEGTIKNPDSIRKSDLSIARQAGPQVALTRVTPTPAATAGGSGTTVVIGAPALTLGTVNTAGSTTTVIAINSAVKAFDTTLPAVVSTSSATGSAGVAARRDHVHGLSVNSILGTGSTSIVQVLEYGSSGSVVWATVTEEKSILVETPTASEDLTIFHTPEKVQITEVRGVLQGGSVSNVWVDVKWAADRSAAGTSVLDAAAPVTSTTTGDVLTLGSTVSNLQPAAGSYVWMETSAGGGTGTLHVSLKMQRVF